MVQTTRYWLTHYSGVFICCLASLFYVYDYFIQVAPGVMTHQLMQSFAIGAGKLSILSASFYYSYTLMQIPAGALLDRLGARVLMTLAVLASAIGVTLFGVTYSFFISCFARFIIGLGSSFAFISTLFLISRWFSHRYFAISAGLLQMGGCIGSLFGLAPLAFLVNYLGWRRSMILVGLITFCFSLLFWVFIRDGVQESGEKSKFSAGYNSSRFNFLLKKPQVWWVCLLGLVSWVPVTTVGALWGLPYFMRVYGLSNIESGKLCSLFWFGLGIGSPVVGWFSSYFFNRRIPAGICFFLGLLGSILIIIASSIPLWVSAISLFLLGISSSVQSLSFGLIKDVVPPNLFGLASGINNMAAILGGAFSQSLIGYLLQMSWDGLRINGAPFYFIQDYQLALLVLPVSSVVGLLVTAFKVKETCCEMNYFEIPISEDNFLNKG